MLRRSYNILGSGLVEVVNVKGLDGLSVVHFLIPSEFYHLFHVLCGGIQRFEVRPHIIEDVGQFVLHGLAVVGEGAQTAFHHKIGHAGAHAQHLGIHLFGLGLAVVGSGLLHNVTVFAEMIAQVFAEAVKFIGILIANPSALLRLGSLLCGCGMFVQLGFAFRLECIEHTLNVNLLHRAFGRLGRCLSLLGFGRRFLHVGH